MNLKYCLSFVLLMQSVLFAKVQVDVNTTLTSQASKITVPKETKKDKKISQLLIEKEVIENELKENNIWSKIYSNYHTYQIVKKEQIILDSKIKKLEKKKKRTIKQEKKLEEYMTQHATLLGKLRLLKEYEKDPFKKFLTPPAIEDVPSVKNPLAIIGALSYKEKLHSDEEEYSSRYNSLSHIMKKFKEKQQILEQLIQLQPEKKEYMESLDDTKEQIKTFAPILEIFQTTKNVYTKKIDETNQTLKKDIKKEIERTITIGAVILFFIFLLFFIKFLVRKYMSDNDRYYTINKALNISFVTVLIFILLFAYIANVSYLITILGFASAGIAIAMKDWFMSLLGWLTIVMGGSIHVGDRVKFQRGNIEYIGDIVDISMLRHDAT